MVRCQQTAGCEKLVLCAVQAPLRFTLEEESSPWLSWLSNRNDRVLRPRRHTGEQSAVAIVNAEGAEPTALQRWFAEEGDVREDPPIASEILQYVRDHGAKSVVTTDRIIGCPHEEGIDYPDGQVCPQCPFWAHRDRWSGEVVQ